MATHNLDELLTIAEAHGEAWALFVEHADGTLELHKTDTYKVLVSDFRGAVSDLEEWLRLVVDAPVTCTDAIAAEVELLTSCRTCEPLYGDV